MTGYCGTTQPIVLPANSGNLTPSNTTLAGDSYKSAGLFAFAYDLAERTPTSGTQHPLMSHVIYGPAGNLAFGGGVRDLEIEGQGVPQGVGYYYNSTVPVTPPIGYVGPTNCTTSSPFVCIPSTGSVIEIDDAKEALFNNLAVYDAYGEGNADFQAALSDADPTNSLNTDFGSIFLNSDRFGVTSNQEGALDPEFGVNFQAVHDSQYSNMVVADGAETDVYEKKGNIYNGLHVLSGVLNGSSPSAIVWTGVPPLAGVALYGLETPKNIALSNMQCDNAWSACLFIGTAAAVDTDAPSAITNIIQKCNGLANVPSTYYGVEAAAGTTGASVSNVSAFPFCGIQNTQLVYFDNPLDGTQTASQNSAAQYCMPLRGFQSGRYYTTPFTAGSTSSFAIVANTLYAIPVPIACAVTVKQLATSVSMGATGSRCEYGIYANNGNGQPGALILDAGNTSTVGSTTPALIGGLSQPLSPGVVFLVVGCNTTPPALRAGSASGTLLVDLIGLNAPTDANALITSPPGAWNYMMPPPPMPLGALPAQVPTPGSYVANTATPLVFFTP